MDPFSAETRRFVGNRTRLRSCRRICDDITTNGPASPATIAKRLPMALQSVLACVARMHQAGWVTLDAGIVSCNYIADSFPDDL